MACQALEFRESWRSATEALGELGMACFKGSQAHRHLQPVCKIHTKGNGWIGTVLKVTIQ